MGSHEIQHLVHEYGYMLVFVVVALQALCLPLPGTTALVAAALYAATAHGLAIEGVVVAGVLGALAGTIAGFAIGRWGGEASLLRIGRAVHQPPERIQQLRAMFAANGGVWLFVGRFVTGLRNLCGLVAGASGMPFHRFLPISAAAALAWALVNALGYYWFGHALLSASTWLQVILICLGLAWLLLSFTLLRRRAIRELQSAPSSGEFS